MSSIEVTKRFDEEIDKIFKNRPEITRFIKNHERKELVVRNLCAEIIKCEKFSLNFDCNKYSKVIGSVARMFASHAIRFAEESIVSENEKRRRIAEADKVKRAEEAMLILEKEAKDEQDKIRVFINENG